MCGDSSPWWSPHCRCDTACVCVPWCVKLPLCYITLYTSSYSSDSLPFGAARPSVTCSTSEVTGVCTYMLILYTAVHLMEYCLFFRSTFLCCSKTTIPHAIHFYWTRYIQFLFDALIHNSKQAYGNTLKLSHN